MKKHLILMVTFFMASALVFANSELEKWKANVSKYEAFTKKFQANFNKARGLYSKAKASGNSAQMSKWKKLAIKFQRNLKSAKSKLAQAKSKVAELSGGGDTGGTTGGAPEGGGQKVTLTAEERKTLGEINAQKKLKEKKDHSKIVTFNTCGNCHKGAVEVWKKTPHFKTFSELHKRKRAKSIVKNMGLKGSIKRNDVCAKCHYTQQLSRGKPKAISGVSCESCHGAGKDWINVHNVRSVPRLKRLENASVKGMNNTEDIYQIAQNCYQCHSVGNEKLVNIGGHKAGSLNFELVTWSQGMVRHNFIRGNNTTNAKSSTNRLRVMYVVGAMLDLEYALRGVGKATSRGKYYTTKMARAKTAYGRLANINKAAGGIPEIQKLVTLFTTLNFSKKGHLLAAANYITLQARKFTKNHDGSKLSVIDRALPAESKYK